MKSQRLGPIIACCSVLMVGAAQAQTAAPPDAAAATAPARSSKTTTLELEATTISGNRELPTVLVIVPWKRAESLDVDGRPVDSLVNSALSPVDRIEMRRELRYAEVGAE